jgi:DNA-directed RNA polymerase subunit RPC12/RpoP
VRCPDCRGKRVAPKGRKYSAIRCSRCGTTYTDLRCPGCGF